MTAQKPTSKDRILAAAAAVARESGPGSLSLDAVAARAGVSKGGLLYNFPTKARLMQGLVEAHLAEFEAALDAAREREGGESLLAAYVQMSARECDDVGKVAAWIFTAMAEDPSFLDPLKAFKRRLLDRLLEEAPDRASVLVAFLALEGLRSMTLFGTDVLTPEEREAVLAALP